MDIKKKNLLRIIDSNFNRAKEGLRVCEDICRFVLDLKGITKSCKDARHQLTEAVSELKILELIKARNIEGDVGKGSTQTEFGRSNLYDVLFANMQRTKESLRVLEEFSKLKNKKTAVKIKALRYKFYGIEKKIVEKI